MLLQASSLLAKVDADECAMGGVGLVALAQAVRAAAAVGSREKRLRTEVFQACDVLREALREGGLEIED